MEETYIELLVLLDKALRCATDLDKLWFKDAATEAKLKKLLEGMLEFFVHIPTRMEKAE